ncbi:MAG: hypothetical protein ACFCU9_10840 [Cyanophyceae cyanobacterium]
MKLGDFFFKSRESLAKVLHVRRFNPFTRSGRQMLKNSLGRQGFKQMANMKLDSNPQAGVQPPQVPGQIKGPAQFKVGSFQVPNPLHKKGGTATAPTGTPSAHPPAPVTAGSPAVVPPQTKGSLGLAPAGSAVMLPGSNPYPQFACQRNDPLGCDIALQTLEGMSKAKFCSQCGFPVPLAPRQELRGRRGSYQVIKLLGKRGLGRLYAGINQSDGQPVVIKEYLLPNRAFGAPEDWQSRQETFVRVAQFRAADGRDQDFRLLPTWDAIADPTTRRCYWIGQGRLGAAPTLAQVLGERGRMDPVDIRRLLDQVLQTLEFLHQQKFQFAAGNARTGLTHGSLSLESLLVAQNGPDFFVYLCDLGFWEQLFDPAVPPGQPLSPEQDLKALGVVGFHLLQGGTSDPLTGQPLDWRDDQTWPRRDTALKDYLKRLLGVGIPLETATAARQALWELPKPGDESQPLATGAEQDSTARRQGGGKVWWLLLLLLLLGLGAWQLVSHLNRTQQPLREELILLPRLGDINDVPTGQFTFSSEVPGIAHRALVQLRFSNPLTGNQNIVERLQQSFSGLELVHTPAESAEAASQQVVQETSTFAITNLMDQPQGDPQGRCQVPYGDSLSRCDVAYDGLMVFVPFIYARRTEGLPRALNGQISFDQLRQLYTGQVANWSELGGPNRRVQLFAPTEPELVRLFEQRVLATADAIEDFRALLAAGTIQTQGTFQTMGQIRADFESQPDVGGIAFGSISIVFGDCNVYPLAVGEGNTYINPIVPGSTLLARNVRTINPNSDLCLLKGQYFLSESAFREGRYPLASPLSLLSLRDNRQEPRYRIGEKVAEMLRSQEGQCLLQSSNLIPLQPVSCE